jgi:curved DNA-binding protein CbpA
MTKRDGPMKTSSKDYYDLLGVEPGATTAQIKTAYRTLAKQYHPDMNNNPDAADRFREITEAYDTLTDPDRRRRYDRLHGTRTSTGTSGGTSSGNASSGNRTRTQNGSSNSNGSQAASRILKVLEDTWLEIRRWHPEIPSVVIIIASGTDRKQTRLGHHAPGRWNVAGEQRTEIMISGEGLRRSPGEVLGTLLHEAAHALAHARGIKDTSRQGRYHNKHFKTCAEELGLTVEHDDRNGWSASTITPATHTAYARQLDALTDAMTLWRHGETITGATPRRNTNLIAAICPCGRSIRVAASTLAEAPIICLACGGKFQAKTATDA